MNILYCGDKGVCVGIFLSALSVCKNTDEDINFYILTANVGEESKNAIPQSFADNLQSAVCKGGKNHRVTLLDISDKFKSELPLANMKTRFTPLCMLRLFADVIPEIPDRVLYLDTDVMCRGDFKEFYCSDISNVEIAGVADRYGKWLFGNVLKHDYLNSGVLLMNMENIRRSGLFEKCRSMCCDKRMLMPDQSALNKLAVKRKAPSRYNAQGKIKDDTVFKHFTTFFRFFPYVHTVTIKPWHTDKMHDELGIFEFDDILEEYEKSSQKEQKDSTALQH